VSFVVNLHCYSICNGLTPGELAFISHWDTYTTECLHHKGHSAKFNCALEKLCHTRYISCRSAGLTTYVEQHFAFVIHYVNVLHFVAAGIE